MHRLQVFVITIVQLRSFQHMTLNTDHIAGGLVLKISPRKSWLLLPNALFLLIWGCGVTYTAPVFLAEWRNHGVRAGQTFLWLILTAAMTMAWLYYFARALFGSDTAIVTPSLLRIESIVLTFTTSRREFDNQTVQNLRYEEWAGGRAGTQSGIRFEYEGETVTFARQAKSNEAWDLIDRMCEVYKFSTPAVTPSPAVPNWSR